MVEIKLFDKGGIICSHSTVTRIEVDGKIVWEAPKFKVGDWVYSTSGTNDYGRVLGFKYPHIKVQFGHKRSHALLLSDEIALVSDD